jgi:hypothetical protein
MAAAGFSETSVGYVWIKSGFNNAVLVVFLTKII